MPKNNFQEFYDYVNSMLSPLLTSNPSFHSELQRAYQHYENQPFEYKIEHGGNKLTLFHCCPSSSKLVSKNNGKLNTVTFCTCVGELVIEEAENKTYQSNSTSSQDFIVDLAYHWHYFTKEGLEIQRSGLTTRRYEPSTSQPTDYKNMHRTLMQYTPYFAFNHTPEYASSTNYQTTSAFFYKRHPQNLSIVESNKHICAMELDEKFALIGSIQDQERIIQEREEFLHQKGAVMTVDKGVTIESLHLLIGTYPQLLDFHKDFVLSDTDINNGRYGIKYFASKLITSPIKQSNPELYSNLKQLVIKKRKEEKKQLKL